MAEVLAGSRKICLAHIQGHADCQFTQGLGMRDGKMAALASRKALAGNTQYQI
jgi:hypothetical protein